MPFRTILAVFLTVVAVMPAVSAQTTKKPWELTLEERIAARTDAGLARERTHRGRVRSNAGEGSRFVDVFEGKTHPELFLPHQVFRTLMSMAFLRPEESRQLFRRTFTPEATLRGLPPDVWERLEAVCAKHIADTDEVNALLASLRDLHGHDRYMAEEALNRKKLDNCGSAADALAAARRDLGQEPFDRFLYEVIAVHMFHATDRLPTAEDLRKIERGCR